MRKSQDDLIIDKLNAIILRTKFCNRPNLRQLSAKNVITTEFLDLNAKNLPAAPLLIGVQDNTIQSD